MKVAVIPARGGSKRIPRKNVREFGGKPMITHSIHCAIESGLFERVIVSTDDAEIADVAVRFGAEAPFIRPPHISDDQTGTTPVVEHAIEWLRETAGTVPSAVCCIYATAPFMRVEELTRAGELLESGRWRFVFAATTFPYPIFRALALDDDRNLKWIFPDKFDTRSQDLPEALHDAGQFYWGTPDAWLDHRNVVRESATVIHIPRWRVQDLDDLEDWRRAEVIWKLLQNNAAGAES